MTSEIEFMKNTERTDISKNISYFEMLIKVPFFLYYIKYKKESSGYLVHHPVRKLHKTPHKLIKTITISL